MPSSRPRIGVLIIVIGALLALAAASTPTAPPVVGHASSAQHARDLGSPATP